MVSQSLARSFLAKNKHPEDLSAIEDAALRRQIADAWGELEPDGPKRADIYFHGGLPDKVVHIAEDAAEKLGSADAQNADRMYELASRSLKLVDSQGTRGILGRSALTRAELDGDESLKWLERAVEMYKSVGAVEELYTAFRVAADKARKSTDARSWLNVAFGLVQSRAPDTGKEAGDQVAQMPVFPYGPELVSLIVDLESAGTGIMQDDIARARVLLAPDDSAGASALAYVSREIRNIAMTTAKGNVPAFLASQVYCHPADIKTGATQLQLAIRKGKTPFEADTFVKPDETGFTVVTGIRGGVETLAVYYVTRHEVNSYIKRNKARGGRWDNLNISARHKGVAAFDMLFNASGY